MGDLFGGLGNDRFDIRSRVASKQSKHKIVVSGIAESMQSKHTSVANFLPTATDLRKARRLAAKLGTSTACRECKKSKRRREDAHLCECCGVKSRGDTHSPDTGEKIVEWSRKIERPLEFTICSLELLSGPQFPPLHTKYRWSAHAVRAFWLTGYKSSSCLGVFNSMPPVMSIAVDNLLTSMELFGGATAQTQPRTRCGAMGAAHRAASTAPP